jgi:hypothetical protein
MDQVLMVLEGADRARVSLLVDGQEVERESGDLDEVPAMMGELLG